MLLLGFEILTYALRTKTHLGRKIKLQSTMILISYRHYVRISFGTDIFIVV